MISPKTVIQRRPRAGKSMLWLTSKGGSHTIWGRSKLSLPIVLKTRSCSLLTMPSKSSPRDAIFAVTEDSSSNSRKMSRRVNASRRLALALLSPLPNRWSVAHQMVVKEGPGGSRALLHSTMVVFVSVVDNIACKKTFPSISKDRPLVRSVAPEPREERRSIRRWT